MMSRNKVILILCILAMAYVLTPTTGNWYIIKHNVLMALPYVMILVIIYLIITINVLKRYWKKLDANLTDENVINFAKMMNITFDVKRMLKPSNLIDLYNKVNFSTQISLHAKELLYEAMRRKRLDVPLPGEGSDVDEILRRSRTKDEIRAARIEADMKAKQRARERRKKRH